MFIHEESEILEILDLGGEDLKISNLLEKYKIVTQESFLYNSNDDYKALLDYISKLYFEQKSIPEDIIDELLFNLNFKSYIVTAIEEKIKNILFDSTTIVFKEIVTITDLLSMGKKFDIFEDYNSYNLENLTLLFKEFEEKLKELKDKDKIDFDLTFKQYTLLIEVINELCAINSMDVIRKKTIKPLIEVITESINLVKFNIQLSENKINILNNILGKLLFYYSHIPYINSLNKDCKYLIDEFNFNFEKICDGYVLSKNTNFGDEGNTKKYYKIFLNSSTTLLCNLIYKLEKDYPKEFYSDLEKFNDILTLYKTEIIHKNYPEIKTLDEFKKLLLDNYLYIYDEDSNHDYKFIVDTFLNEDSFSNADMYVLYSVILFSDEIEENKLIHVLKKIVSLEKFKNDYHEFLKLNICDIIINKFVDTKNHELDDILIDRVIEYVKKNKIASHLMPIYSKIYLTLSLYYSYNDDFISNEKSKLFYFYYVKINGYDLLENEYIGLNKTILLNLGKKYISDFELENVLISDAKCLEVGKKILDKFVIQEEIKLKYNINQQLSNIITEIFTDDGLNDDLLNSHIENFISNDIFHGLTFVAIEGLCKDKCSLIDLGYDRIEIPLFDKYKLKIAYSKVYKHIFEKIYDENKAYIKQNIINLIICYIKSIPIYNDIVTGLYNIEKLKLDLLKNDADEFIYIKLYIEDLIFLNKKHGYEKVNGYFKEYAQEINKIVGNLYRLHGPKLSFILNTKEDYKNIIEKIKEVKIKTKDEELEANLIIAVSWGNKNNIIEKSNLCLNFAEEDSSKYYEFK